jgi:hypothetical protein
MFLINPYILQASGNPLWNDLLAYYTADNTPNDALGSYDLTLYNGTTYTTGIINNGFSFDGVNDYAETTATRVGHGNSDSFTISCWANTSDVRNRGLVVDGDTGVGGTLGIWTNGVTGFTISLLKGQGSAICNGNTVLSNSTLYHLVVVHTPYDGVSANVQFYVNGSPDGSAIFDIGTPSVATVKQIGTKSDTATFYTGMIDEVGIWSRDLSASEVTDLYNSGAGLQYPTGILPLWSDLLAYYTADNTPNDALGTYNGTLTNGATYGTGIINNGFSFDGVNDYVDIGNNLDFDGSTPFSISCWIKTSVTGANQVFVSKFNSSTVGYLFRKSSNGSNLNFVIGAGSSAYFSINSVGLNLVNNVYSMITVTYDGTGGAGVKFYQDGVLLSNSGIWNTYNGSSSSNTESFKIGSFDNSYFFNGSIDEVSVFNKELSASEVTELYNSGAGLQY